MNTRMAAIKKTVVAVTKQRREVEKRKQMITIENVGGFLYLALAAIGIVVLLALMIIEACGKVTKTTLGIIVLVAVTLLIVWAVVTVPDNSVNTYEDIERMSVQERIRSEQMILGR